MSDIKQEIISVAGGVDFPFVEPNHEPQSDIGEEDMGKFCKSNVAPKLTCMGCKGFFRGPVTYCQNGHGLCSICFGDKEKCPITRCGQKASLTLNVLSELVKELKFPVPCKFKKVGCGQENAEEEVIANHEEECGHRKVSCIFTACSTQLAMDFETHLFSAHEHYRKFRDNPSQWFFNNFTGTKISGAQKMWIEPESGLRFRAVLVHYDEEKYWKCFTVVFGGKNVAKKFRAEMRLSSYDGDTSIISNCNVKCLDDWKEVDASQEFCITDYQFKIYNKGHIELGAHNKDKNGELTMPVSVEVKMKKLNMG